MSDRFAEIGDRLKAYRLASGLRAEDIAERLGVSRAAVYRIEAGEVVKIETIERLADVLGTSMASLLGVGVEYHPHALSYFERMRQLEADADQVVAHFEPVSYLLTSNAYAGHLRLMLLESLPTDLAKADANVARKEIEGLLSILEERKTFFHKRRFNVVSFVMLSEIERFLQLGLIGRFDLPVQQWTARREAARLEIENLVRLLVDEPIGVQIGIVDETMPNVTFQLLRGPQRTVLAVSPFRLGEQPNLRVGVATITAAAEPVALYEKLVADLWRRAHKGARGAAMLQAILRRAERGLTQHAKRA
jgi:transcriptional regulator with XRE-family HTH domain